MPSKNTLITYNKLHKIIKEKEKKGRLYKITIPSLPLSHFFIVSISLNNREIRKIELKV